MLCPKKKIRVAFTPIWRGVYEKTMMFCLLCEFVFKGSRERVSETRGTMLRVLRMGNVEIDFPLWISRVVFQGLLYAMSFIFTLTVRVRLIPSFVESI